MHNQNNEQISQYEIPNFRQDQLSLQISQLIKKQKKLRLKIKKSRIYRKKNHGLWTLNQQYLFMYYMNSHLQIFKNKDLRRKMKIFKQMSKFIKTRSSEQCRSHHQKYQLRFICSQQIISHINKKVGEDKNVEIIKSGDKYKNSQNDSSQALIREKLGIQSYLGNKMGSDETKKYKQQSQIKINQGDTLSGVTSHIIIEKHQDYEVLAKYLPNFQIIVNINVQKFLQLPS